MLMEKRYEIILDLLKEHQTITIKDITDATAVSETTIRRDLTDLEKQNKLERIHGGATLTTRKLREFSIQEKSAKNNQDKKNIAEIAASFVQTGDCIYLDAGTTTLQLIPFLKDKEVVVVTNGLTHTEHLIEHGIKAYLTGGMIKAKTRALIGPQVIQSIQGYRFDSCFLGVNGFHEKAGYTTPDPEEATIKQVAQQHAVKTYVLADRSKYNMVSFAKISDLQSAALITSQITEMELIALQKHTTVRSV